MFKINSKKSRTIRKRNKLLRIGIRQDSKSNFEGNIPIKLDPSAVVFVGSQPIHQRITGDQVNNRQEPSFILQDDAMLIPMNNINEVNFELLMSTLNRQGKRWNLTSLSGKNFFKIRL